MNFQNILDFWFDPAHADLLFKKDDTFDTRITQSFLETYEAAAAGDLDIWVQAPDSRLALIIVLDQFPRNMFRGQAKAFATDRKAQSICLEGIGFGHDMALPDIQQRIFFYLPLEHAEDPSLQDRCVQLMTDNIGSEDMIKYAVWHKEIIDRFGRFPHRNAAMGRESTAEEVQYLADGGRTF